MRSSTRVVCGLSLVLVVSLAGPSAGSRVEVDAVASGKPRPEAAQALLRLRTDPDLRRLAGAVQTDSWFGVPTFVWAIRGGAVAGSGARPVARPTPEQAARAHLDRLAPLYRLDALDVRGAELREVHDTGRGGIIVSFRQVLKGVEVFRDEVKVLMDRNLDLVAVSGFIPGRAVAGEGGPPSFRLGPADAIARALEDFAGVAFDPAGIRRTGDTPGGFETFEVPAARAPQDVLGQPIRSKKVYFHRPEALEPAHYVEVMADTAAYSYVVSAVDGTILFRNDLMASDAFSYRVWADGTSLHAPLDGPQGNTPTPHPTGFPDYFAPPFIPPALVTLQNGPISTQDPWLAPGAIETVGNNVDAYADLVAPDGFSAGDLRASTTAPGTFDRVYAPTMAPNANATQRMAAVTQLFYTNNFLHDWYYDAGFDEASGNAQAFNYGRGGIGGDRMRAEAQDYGGFNNANMTTPADGAPPRMQMFVFVPAGLVKVTVNAPALGDLIAGTASFGPQSFSITGNVVLADDASGTTSDACQPIVNAVAGKIALVDRGACSDISKVVTAQAAGAIGVIIVDNAPGASPPVMGGTDPSITIPALSLTLADGNSIKTALGGGGVNVTMARQPDVNRDGTIDNQVVAHEWGHCISNRLIGNGNGLTTVQARGMGEGWSDFHALLLTVKPEDAVVASNPNFSGVYGLAGYAKGSSLVPSNSYYFGVRRLPYSTDFAKNALTFKHIQNGVALPVGPPTAFGTDGANNAQVHSTGEVWCTMLWECYATLLRDTGRLTFEEARDRMRRYLVAAYKMTPLNPTFTEARDAVLAAALANDPVDFAAFWQAFATRGIGVGAVSPDRFAIDNVGVVESFAVGGDLELVSAEIGDDVHSCDDDGYLDEGEIGNLSVTLRNNGATALDATTATITSPNPTVVFPSGNQIIFGGTLPGETTTGHVQVRVQGASGVEDLNLQIAYDDPGLLVAGPRTAFPADRGNADEVPSALETVESKASVWGMAGDPALAHEPWRRITISPEQHRFFAPDPGSRSDQYLVSPPLHVAPTGNLAFTFRHAYTFETAGLDFFDGGVIEISNNGGASWTDIGGASSPGYGGAIYIGSNNPLSGRPAFVSHNASYPGLDLVTVDLGTVYAGQTVQVRFRLGADEAVSSYGWEVDDLTFFNLADLPFLEVVAEPDVCSLLSSGEQIPREWSLAIAGANPARGEARFRFALPVSGHAELSIVDVTGRRVATLADGVFEAGFHTARWSPGGARSAGVYFAHMMANGRNVTLRFVVLQ